MLSMKALLDAYAATSKSSTSETIPINLYEENAQLPIGDSTCAKLRLLHRLRMNKLPVSTPLASRHVAICAVIVDELYHEEIWRSWIENASVCSASLHIHAKDTSKIRSSWVQERIIEENHRPEWNSPEVVRAILGVLHHALKITSAERFMLVTESCIPLYDLDTMGSIIFSDNRSWLNASNTPQSAWEAGNCFGGIDTSIIPSETRWKALPGWIMLTRRHASDIIGLLQKTGGWSAINGRYGSDLVTAFGSPGQWREGSGGAYAPEEMFFATTLSILGYLRPGYDKLGEVKMQSAMFAEWEKRTDANPIIFDSLDDRLLDKARRSGAIMMRKFKKSRILVDYWKRAVLPKVAELTTPDSVVNSDVDSHQEQLATGVKRQLVSAAEEENSVDDSTGDSASIEQQVKQSRKDAYDNIEATTEK